VLVVVVLEVLHDLEDAGLVEHSAEGPAQQDPPEHLNAAEEEVGERVEVAVCDEQVLVEARPPLLCVGEHAHRLPIAAHYLD
jgi:hypothetical protein